MELDEGVINTSNVIPEGVGCAKVAVREENKMIIIYIYIYMYIYKYK